MNLSIVPKDSCLQHWVKMLNCTEIPVSYQLAGGLTVIGALLKRNVWVDQAKWKVYPSQSVLFVGPSGIGKDTIINKCTQEIDKWKVVPVLGGKTMEAVNARLANLGALAAAYIPAGELSAFFGQRDYQSGMIQEFTDLLSGGEKKDITTKGDLFNGGQPKFIHKPTLTLHGGTTEEWLHKAMPDGTMEGGFLGRFLLVVEQLTNKHIALIKYNISKQDQEEIKLAETLWDDAVGEIIGKYRTPTEMLLMTEAQEYYTNWYFNRFNYFSKTVMPYANRSRDMVLRLAMLMAITRKHWNWIDEQDVEFGAKVLIEVGKDIDRVVLPPTNEAQATRAILMMLPASSTELWKALNQKFPLRVLQTALQLLSETGQIKKGRGGNWLRTDGND